MKLAIITIFAIIATASAGAFQCGYGCGKGPNSAGKCNCVSWETGPVTWCGANKDQCNKCNTKDYGHGVWCPGGMAEAPVENKHDKNICKYHCAGGDCDKCTGTEPSTKTWCSASKDNCEDGKGAPNQGGGCGGTYCSDKSDMSFLKTLEKKKKDPVAKNCAYGCADGCPKDRKKGDTNGCTSWESGDSFCNLSKENCKSCKTKKYGHGKWCPASRDMLEADAPVDNKHDKKICKYHCASGDCDKCTGTEPSTKTWCSASKDNCEDGKHAPNKGGGCGGTYCSTKSDMSFLSVVTRQPMVEKKKDPVAKNCAYGCADGCPKDRAKGDTNGCTAWESGDSWCNLSKKNCKSCETKKYGHGKWCPAGKSWLRGVAEA